MLNSDLLMHHMQICTWRFIQCYIMNSEQLFFLLMQCTFFLKADILSGLRGDERLYFISLSMSWWPHHFKYSGFLKKNSLWALLSMFHTKRRVSFHLPNTNTTIRQKKRSRKTAELPHHWDSLNENLHMEMTTSKKKRGINTQRLLTSH